MSADKDKSNLGIMFGAEPMIEPKPKYFLRSGKERSAWFEVKEAVFPPGRGERVDMPMVLIAVHRKLTGFYLAGFGGN